MLAKLQRTVESRRPHISWYLPPVRVTQSVIINDSDEEDTDCRCEEIIVLIREEDMIF
jgi:hypothetical protein